MRSVKIKSTDRQQIISAVQAYVTRLRETFSEVESVIWFGSWVNGLPSAGSDVDLCLILSGSDTPFRERTLDYLPVGFPVGIDLFPYTREEFERLKHRSPQWYAAISSGKTL